MSDELLRRLGELNPVPDPGRFVALGEPDWPADPVLRAVLEQAATTNHRPRTARPGPERDPAPKERRMPTLTPPRNDANAHPEHQSRRRWLLAAAIAVVVLAAGGLFTKLGSMFTDVVIAPAATEAEQAEAEEARFDQAIEIAQAYIDARNAYDADQARELVSDYFTTSEFPPAYTTVKAMEPAFELHEAYGFHYSHGDCELDPPRSEQMQDDGQVAVVVCDYLWTSELQRITGYPPVPARFVFRVQDGQIIRISPDWDEDEFWPNVYEPWLDFLDRIGIEAGWDALATHRLDPERTRAFIEQAPEYLALYEEWVEDQAATDPEADAE